MWAVPLKSVATFAVFWFFPHVTLCAQNDDAPQDRRGPIVRVVEKTKPSIVTVKAPRYSGKDTSATGVIV
ncbi:MAG: hypothetical protein L0Y70_05810, partial [Gemmataceae bacterium]|nr:hypothetical protein [Gemmataceae bacterium]